MRFEILIYIKAYRCAYAYELSIALNISNVTKFILLFWSYIFIHFMDHGIALLETLILKGNKLTFIDLIK